MSIMRGRTLCRHFNVSKEFTGAVALWGGVACETEQLCTGTAEEGLKGYGSRQSSNVAHIVDVCVVSGNVATSCIAWF